MSVPALLYEIEAAGIRLHRAGDTLRAEIPQPAQQLTIRVNGDAVRTEAVPPGSANIRALLEASAGVRRVDLQWSTAKRLSSAGRVQNDARAAFCALA